MRLASMTVLLVLALVGALSCGSPTPAETSGTTVTSGDETATSTSFADGETVASTARSSCITDADRAAIDVSAPTSERFEEAFGAIDVPADASGLDPLTRTAAAVRALVLFDSIERESIDPSQARVSAMLAIDVLGTLAAGRPACGNEACARMGPLLRRHCPVELPDDDLTAICPTLTLYAQRCVGAAP